MRYIILILFLLPVFVNAQLVSLVVRGDTLFSIDPTTGVERQLTKLVPTQQGQSGKVLSTNGTAYQWIDPPSSVDWSTVTNKPATFTPSTHGHDWSGSDITNKPTIPTNTNQLTNGAGFITASLGYTLSVQALTSSPADGQTIYFGQLPKAPVTAAATSKIYIRKAGTIKQAQVYCYSGTAGTAEAWVMSIRLNNTTDTEIASVAVSASERIFTNSSLSIAVAAGDYIEIKSVNPTWATNPLTTIFGGYIYIE